MVHDQRHWEPISGRSIRTMFGGIFELYCGIFKKPLDIPSQNKESTNSVANLENIWEYWIGGSCALKFSSLSLHTQSPHPHQWHILSSHNRHLRFCEKYPKHRGNCVIPDNLLIRALKWPFARKEWKQFDNKHVLSSYPGTNHRISRSAALDVCRANEKSSDASILLVYMFLNIRIQCNKR